MYELTRRGLLAATAVGGAAAMGGVAEAAPSDGGGTDAFQARPINQVSTNPASKTLRHVRSLAGASSLHASDLGSVSEVSAQTLPIMKRMAMRRLSLAPTAIREPHWHANADELGYCIAGKILVSIIDDHDKISAVTVTKGQLYHVDVGAMHWIDNIGDETAEVVVAFSDESPTDFSLRASFGAMTNAVLGNTFGLPERDFAALPRDTQPVTLMRRIGPPAVPSTTVLSDNHKFDMAAEAPAIDFPYGSARVLSADIWSAPRHLAMYDVQIRSDGMRAAHWHPDTAEMGYVLKGHARMTILDPNGTTDTYLLKAGDMYFVPRSYPHQIEVLDDEIHFAIFFDQISPQDIGYKLVGSAIAPALMAATFGVPEAALPNFPKITKDPLIVAKINPLDTV